MTLFLVGMMMNLHTVVGDKGKRKSLGKLPGKNYRKITSYICKNIYTHALNIYVYKKA